MYNKILDMSNNKKDLTQSDQSTANRIGESRTDLALEARESFEDDNVEIQGVELNEEYDEKNDIRVTTVKVKDQKGAKAMGKPIGTYITIEAPKLGQEDESFHEPITKEIAKHIKQLTGVLEKKKILIAGLGNREITPDALGPQVIDNLFITRHLIKEYGPEFQVKNNLGDVSAISPGVMAQTGMEASEVLRGIIRETIPDLVIVIDALAARSIHRLNTTIQITDTGISPGSGVGNNRKALNKESLGVEVIALGVPTVVDAATIVNDTMEHYMTKQGLSEKEIHQFLSEVNDQGMSNMFVTPKNIDESIKRTSYTISEALNKCFS